LEIGRKLIIKEDGGVEIDTYEKEDKYLIYQDREEEEGEGEEDKLLDELTDNCNSENEPKSKDLTTEELDVSDTKNTKCPTATNHMTKTTNKLSTKPRLSRKRSKRDPNKKKQVSNNSATTHKKNAPTKDTSQQQQTTEITVDVVSSREDVTTERKEDIRAKDTDITVTPQEDVPKADVPKKTIKRKEV